MTDPSKPTPPAPGQPMHEETTAIESPKPTPPDAPVEKPVDPTPPAPSKHAATEEAKAVEQQDVDALLSRHTFDGKGDNAVPPSSFRGFATEGVEKEKPLKSAEEVVNEILAGHWGTTVRVAITRLNSAGYGEKLDEIEQEYNKRKAAGAPSSF